LTWPDGIGLGLGSVLLYEVLGSILSGANLGGLVWLLRKEKKLSQPNFKLHGSFSVRTGGLTQKKRLLIDFDIQIYYSTYFYITIFKPKLFYLQLVEAVCFLSHIV